MSAGSAVLACGGAVASEGNGSAQSGARGDSPGLPTRPSPGGLPAQPSAAPADFTIEPANVTEARKQCENPPTDWVPTESPDPADYARHDWVMCARPTASGFTVPATSWQMHVDVHGYAIEGRPLEGWTYTFERGVMFLWFPIDDTNAYGEGHGPPQHPRGGAVHWLRLAVDPDDSGALAPKLHGMSEAIFVRIKRAADDPRAIDDGGLAP